jgi:hypothetical protein
MRVLQTLRDDGPVPSLDAFQLRNWAVNAEDALLPLEEIAQRILTHEENPKAAGQHQRSKYPLAPGHWVPITTPRRF